MTDEAPARKPHWIQLVIIAVVIVAIGGLIAATLAESSAPATSPSVDRSPAAGMGNVSAQHLDAEERTYLPLEPSPVQPSAEGGSAPPEPAGGAAP